MQQGLPLASMQERNHFANLLLAGIAWGSRLLRLNLRDEDDIRGDGCWTSTWTLDSDGEAEEIFGNNALESLDGSQEPRTRLVNRSCILLSFANWTFALPRCTSLFFWTPSATFPEPRSPWLKKAAAFDELAPQHKSCLYSSFAQDPAASRSDLSALRSSVVHPPIEASKMTPLVLWSMASASEVLSPACNSLRDSLALRYHFFPSLVELTFMIWNKRFSVIISRVTLDTAGTPVPPVASVKLWDSMNKSCALFLNVPRGLTRFSGQEVVADRTVGRNSLSFAVLYWRDCTFFVRVFYSSLEAIRKRTEPNDDEVTTQFFLQKLRLCSKHNSKLPNII